jgi:hypothetical protein
MILLQEAELFLLLLDISVCNIIIIKVLSDHYMLYQLVEQLQLAFYVHQRAEPQQAGGGPPPHAALPPAGASGAGGSCLLLRAI